MLGTFAEITLTAYPCDADAQGATDAAFAAVGNVQKMMSFHDPHSALSRLNQAPVGTWVPIPPALYTVLALGERLHEQTAGVFHMGVGNSLVARGWLPQTAVSENTPDGPEASFELRTARARRTAPRLLDLGGIAKGYAVDVAVQSALAAAPKIEGCVNIGGELRVFGGYAPQAVMVRVSHHEPPAYQPWALSQAAMATSSVRVTQSASAFVDTYRRGGKLLARTAVVQGPTCMLADAFTKIALLSPLAAAQALAVNYNVTVAVFP